MRRALHGIAFLIKNLRYRNGNVASVRLHDLDGFAYGKLIPLLNLVQTVLSLITNDAKIRIFFYLGVAVIDLGLFTWFAIEKSSGELTIRTVGNLIQIPWHILLIQRRILLVIIDRFAVGTGNRSHIQSCLHTSLNLQTVDSGIDRIRYMFDHAQLLGVEYVGSALILFNRHIFARTGLLHHRLFPAAGMGTCALVGISSCKIVAQQAAS